MTAPRADVLRVPRQVRDAMVAHARFCHPYEAAGLVAFDHGVPRFAYALTNRAGSPHRYLVDPTEHFRALQHADSLGWVIGGVFHSHPQGPAIPSSVDIAEARDPSWLYFIVARREVRAWTISGVVTEVPLEVV